MKQLIRIKTTWTETMPSRVFELEDIAKSLWNECEALGNTQDEIQTWADSPVEKNTLLGTWDLLENVANRCFVDAAVPIQQHLLDTLNRQSVAPAPLTASRLSSSGFLTILAGYESMVQRLRHYGNLLRPLLNAMLLARHKANVKAARELEFDDKSESGKSTLRDEERRAHERAQRLKSLLQSRLDDDPQGEQIIDHAKKVLKSWHSMFRNQHFPNRAPANNYYIGHRTYLDSIEHAFDQPLSPEQKRFVVQGPPGSGKTELALRYATENLARFWGVFWVDASNKDNANRSFIEIAKLFGVNTTMQAAKSFLASRHPMHPWLLIIDNADDDNLAVEEMLPQGPKGNVIITTRNPAKLNLGNAGSKYVQLDKMALEDASDLLLKAARYNEEISRRPKVRQIAGDVCKELQYLPLALVYAGKAIWHHNLRLADYIAYFKREARILSLEWKRRRKSYDSSTQSLLDVDGGSQSLSMSVFASFELLTIRQLEMASRDPEEFHDALQLLQVFSYMHNENIRVDFLIHAVINPIRERIDRKDEERIERKAMLLLGVSTRTSWSERAQDLLRAAADRLSLRPVVPEALKTPGLFDLDDVKGQVSSRVRVALSLLSSRGLITRANPKGEHYVAGSDEEDRHADAYNMHPLVHEWIRGRPRLSDAQKALHCQCALTILANTVRLVRGDGEEDRLIRQHLKPHIDHALKCAAVLQAQLRGNMSQGSGSWLRSSLAWTGLLFPMARFQAKMHISQTARFGKVFLESGEFKMAEEHFLKTQDQLSALLGPKNDAVNLPKLGLAISLMMQTRRREAAAILREVYNSRLQALGQRHPRTLDSTMQLGESVLAVGRFTEGLQLCTAAYDGFVQAYGRVNKQTIKCLNLIGLINSFFFNYTVAIASYRDALERTEELHASMEGDSEKKNSNGVPEVDVLIYKECLVQALIYQALGTSDTAKRRACFEEAEREANHIVQRRRIILGKGHPYTLYGTATKARAQAMRAHEHGDTQMLDEAGTLLADTIAAATQDDSIGESHLGVLAGQKWYGEILVMQGRLPEAEACLRQSSRRGHYEKSSGVDGEHPDRIFAVWELIKCLERFGEREKLEEALGLCRELEANIPLVGGHGLGVKHKFNGLLKDKIEMLKSKLAKTS